ncbi:MAG: hypothetical protein Q7J03_07150 [Methanoregula sp.]|nr:hypothetical protein [Methanoregula sp.]
MPTKSPLQRRATQRLAIPSHRLVCDSLAGRPGMRRTTACDRRN